MRRMKTAADWEDYEILATARGMKLERWGEYKLLRPDPQIIWGGRDLEAMKPDAVYRRSSSGGGKWEIKTSVPSEWTIRYKDLSFSVKPMGFKHMGLFPEQAANWDEMRELIKKASKEKGEIKVLNLFAYTGGASVACAKEGAKVTHVDAAKGMVARAGDNARLSGADGIRYIVDDCTKFIEREIRRGNLYDAVIMDPPSYGRGPSGEMWKIEDDLFGLVKECSKLLSADPVFFLLNSYTTGLQPETIKNILTLALGGAKGEIDSYEVGLPTDEGINLPCGCSGMFVGERYGRG